MFRNEMASEWSGWGNRALLMQEEKEMGEGE
jgi:hypothetical protein